MQILQLEFVADGEDVIRTAELLRPGQATLCDRVEALLQQHCCIAGVEWEIRCKTKQGLHMAVSSDLHGIDFFEVVDALQASVMTVAWSQRKTDVNVDSEVEKQGILHVPKQPASHPPTKNYGNDAAVIVPAGLIDWQTMEQGLAAITWPINHSRKIMKNGADCYGFALGLVQDYYNGKLCVSKQHTSGPNLCQLALKWIQQEEPGFTFTSIQFNKNVEARLHIDANNSERDSMFFEFGASAGLWKYDPVNGGAEIEVAEKLPCEWGQLLPLGKQVKGSVLRKRGRFAGKKPHMTMDPIEGGDRYSLIFYSVSGTENMLPEVRDKFLAMGFPADMDGELMLPADLAVGEGKNAEKEDDHDERMIMMLQQRLVHDNPLTALKEIKFNGQMALLRGECQMGKSAEISLAAWLAAFHCKALPVIFVKNMGGREAQAQLLGNISTFNERITQCLRELMSLPSRRAAAGFHLKASTDVDDFRPQAPYAQVLVLLSNPSQVKSVKNKVAPQVGKDPNGKFRMVFIFDEDDLNITSSDRVSSKVGAELFGSWNDGTSLREQVLQVLSVTATIGAVALAESKPAQLMLMPIHPQYYGLSPRLPEDKQPTFKPIEPEDMEDNEELGFPKGVQIMVFDMLQNASFVQCTGLVHTETRIESHCRLQKSLCDHFGASRLVVVTHNGGRNHQTLGSSGEGSESSNKYSIEGNYPLTCAGSSAIADSLASFLKEELGNDINAYKLHEDLHRFGKRFKLMDVLSHLLKFRLQEHACGRGALVIIILSGHAGGRGTTFRDSSHRMVLTDMYLSRDETLPGEYLMQIANRLSGLQQQPPQRLQLWTSQNMYDTVKVHAARLQEISGLLQKEGGKPLKEILQENPGYLKLEELPSRNLARKRSAPLITRRKVEEEFVEQRFGYTDVGNRPGIHHGGDVTDFVLLAMSERLGANVEDLMVQNPIEEDWRFAAQKAFPDVDTPILMLDEVLVVPIQSLPDDIRSALQEHPSADCKQYQLTKLVRSHLDVKTAEWPKSSERYGRAATIMRRELSQNDYCQAVIQKDSDRLIILKRTLDFDDFISRRKQGEQDADSSPLFAWRAFREPSNEGSPIRFDIMLARVRSACASRLEVGAKRARKRPPVSAQRTLVDACKDLLALKAGQINKKCGAEMWRTQAAVVKAAVEDLPSPIDVAVKSEMKEMFAKFQSRNSDWRPFAKKIVELLEKA